MDKRLKASVLGLSYNPLQSGAFALLLAVEDSPMRIPIIIGAAEAQSIAIRMEKVSVPRPMTHDLFISFAHAFGIRLKEVFIYKFEDGIFSSELTFVSDSQEVVIDSRTSDAIAIAMRSKAPIYITQAIVDEVGIEMSEVPLSDSDTEENADDDSNDIPQLEQMAIPQLEKLMSQLIEDENYEEAAHIKEIISAKLEAKDASDNVSDDDTQGFIDDNFES